MQQTVTQHNHKSCAREVVKNGCDSRSISKEEKEKENNKKSSPTKPMSSRPLRPSTAPDKTQDNDRKKVSCLSVFKNLSGHAAHRVTELK